MEITAGRKRYNSDGFLGVHTHREDSEGERNPEKGLYFKQFESDQQGCFLSRDIQNKNNRKITVHIFNGK
jgi:hypothetical protein